MEKKKKKVNKEKERRKGKIFLFIGLLPYILLLIYIIFSMIFGIELCFFECGSKEFGFKAVETVFIEISIYIVALPYVVLPIVIVSTLLIIKGLTLLENNPKKQTKKTSKN